MVALFEIAYGGSGFLHLAAGTSSTSTPAPQMVGPDEFRAFQQQVTGQLRSNAQAVTAQEVDVKRLSD